MALVEPFGGIGAAREALEILRADVSGYFVGECDKAAQNVTKVAWPSVKMVDHVEAMDEDWFREQSADSLSVDTVVVVAGFPYQPFSGANYTGRGRPAGRADNRGAADQRSVSCQLAW